MTTAYLELANFGNASNWTVTGQTFTQDGWNFIRNPGIWKGNPESKESWGTNPDGSEWDVVNWGAQVHHGKNTPDFQFSRYKR